MSIHSRTSRKAVLDWSVPRHNVALKIQQRLVALVLDMNMGRIMIIEVHTYDNTKKP